MAHIARSNSVAGGLQKPLPSTLISNGRWDANLARVGPSRPASEGNIAAGVPRAPPIAPKPNHNASSSKLPGHIAPNRGDTADSLSRSSVTTGSLSLENNLYASVLQAIAKRKDDMSPGNSEEEEEDAWSDDDENQGIYVTSRTTQSAVTLSNVHSGTTAKSREEVSAETFRSTDSVSSSASPASIVRSNSSVNARMRSSQRTERSPGIDPTRKAKAMAVLQSFLGARVAESESSSRDLADSSLGSLSSSNDNADPSPATYFDRVPLASDATSTASAPVRGVGEGSLSLVTQAESLADEFRGIELNSSHDLDTTDNSGSETYTQHVRPIASSMLATLPAPGAVVADERSVTSFDNITDLHRGRTMPLTRKVPVNRKPIRQWHRTTFYNERIVPYGRLQPIDIVPGNKKMKMAFKSLMMLLHRCRDDASDAWDKADRNLMKMADLDFARMEKDMRKESGDRLTAMRRAQLAKKKKARGGDVFSLEAQFAAEVAECHSSLAQIWQQRLDQWEVSVLEQRSQQLAVTYRQLYATELELITKYHEQVERSQISQTFSEQRASLSRVYDNKAKDLEKEQKKERKRTLRQRRDLAEMSMAMLERANDLSQKTQSELDQLDSDEQRTLQQLEACHANRIEDLTNHYKAMETWALSMAKPDS